MIGISHRIDRAANDSQYTDGGVMKANHFNKKRYGHVLGENANETKDSHKLSEFLLAPG